MAGSAGSAGRALMVHLAFCRMSSRSCRVMPLRPAERGRRAIQSRPRECELRCWAAAHRGHGTARRARAAAAATASAPAPPAGRLRPGSTRATGSVRPSARAKRGHAIPSRRAGLRVAAGTCLGQHGADFRLLELPRGVEAERVDGPQHGNLVRQQLLRQRACASSASRASGRGQRRARVRHAPPWLSSSWPQSARWSP